MNPTHPDDEYKLDFAWSVLMQHIIEWELRAERLRKQRLLPTFVYIAGSVEGPRLPQELS